VPNPTDYSSQQNPSQQYSSQHYSTQQYSAGVQQYPPQEYSPQQYSSLQLSPNPSRRSTLPTTPTYGHASLPPQPPAPLPLSGSTSYNPSFPVPVRHQSTNPSGPPPTAHRAATMPMPVPVHTASSTLYGMQSQNPMHSLSRSGIVGGPQPTTQCYGLRASTTAEFPTVRADNRRLTAVVHERTDDHRNFGGQDFEQSREGTHQSGEYMRERAPPSYNAAGMQQQELVRCMICRRVTTRVAAESRRWYCTGGHMGQWQLVVIILSLYKTNNRIPLCPITVGPYHKMTKITHIIRQRVTVLTWRTCILCQRDERQAEVLRCYSAPHSAAPRLELVITLQDCKLCG
jgi:hypothetical protein